MATNPSSYFEIAVEDLNRAVRFYRTVFGYEFEISHVDGNEMAFFPFSERELGSSGALAKGDSYRPGAIGARIYFDVPDIDIAILNASKANGAVLFPKTDMGAFGNVAEIQDSEGNCIGLRELKKAT